MGRYVAEQYIDTPVGSFVNLTEVNLYFAELPKKDTSNQSFNYMLELYMDDYIA